MNLEANTWHTTSAEQLTQLGKTAAQTAETSGMSLTDAAVRSIGMTKLNEQQIRRVVEAANHEAFHRKFASMDPSMRVVELDGGPADASAVIERLKAASAPARPRSMSEYSMEPTRKTAAVSQSGVHDVSEKRAALADISELREQLQATHIDLAERVSVSSYYITEDVQKLAAMVKSACLDGAFFEDFERAWGSISPKHATELLSALNPTRAPHGVKTASRVISEGHPIRSTFDAFVKHAHDYEVACEALREVEGELVRVSDFLRSNR
jgi:hypothetical protein